MTWVALGAKTTLQMLGANGQKTAIVVNGLEYPNLYGHFAICALAVSLNVFAVAVSTARTVL